MLMISLPVLIFSQVIEIGPLAGLSLYYGDLSPEGFNSAIQNTNLAGGGLIRLNTKHNLAFRLAGIHTKLTGDDTKNSVQRDRKLNFQTHLTELSLTAEWHFIRLGSSRYGAIYPFVYAGVGMFYFNPKGRLNQEWIELHELGTEGQGLPEYPEQYDLVQPMIPIGGGFKMDIENFGTIALEIGARKLFTDYVDDVSGTRINYQDILENHGIVAARLSYPQTDPKDLNTTNFNYRRGSSEFMDWYYVMNVSFSIPIATITRDGIKGAGFGCPKF